MSDPTTANWQPIESAPKDGTEVLLWFPSLRHPFQMGSFEENEHRSNGRVTYRSARWHWGSRIIGLPGAIEPEPSHWAPIPDGPTDIWVEADINPSSEMIEAASSALAKISG